MKLVMLSAILTGRVHPSVDILGIHFCYRLSRPQGHSTAWRIMSMKNRKWHQQESNKRSSAMWRSVSTDRAIAHKTVSATKYTHSTNVGITVYGRQKNPHNIKLTEHISTGHSKLLHFKLFINYTCWVPLERHSYQITALCFIWSTRSTGIDTAVSHRGGKVTKGRINRPNSNE
jgi:hypothetical protein